MTQTTPIAPIDASRLRIGVAGWSYPDWKDTVYRIPVRPEQPDLFGRTSPETFRYPDRELPYLARFVDLVEINSSFYRIPQPRHAESWAQQVEHHPQFRFTAKLHQDFTHEGRQNTGEAETFRTALTPLVRTGRLTGLLAQFRYDFRFSFEGRERIRWLNEQFGPFAPLVVEVRHRSWQQKAALDFFKEHNITVANLDYPTAADSFDMPCCITSTRNAYFRLHGRNRQAWFASRKNPHEPYDYDYPDSEISELANRARKLLQNVKHLTIVANNHYRGKAVSAAVRLKAALTRQKVPIPPALLQTYPALKRIAR